MQSIKLADMDASQAKFPLCVTWASIDCVTWFFPFLGHTGICKTDGLIHDYAGSHKVCIDKDMQGRTLKYVPLLIKEKDY